MDLPSLLGQLLLATRAEPLLLFPLGFQLPPGRSAALQALAVAVGLQHLTHACTAAFFELPSARAALSRWVRVRDPGPTDCTRLHWPVGGWLPSRTRRWFLRRLTHCACSVTGCKGTQRPLAGGHRQPSPHAPPSSRKLVHLLGQVPSRMPLPPVSIPEHYPHTCWLLGAWIQVGMRRTAGPKQKRVGTGAVPHGGARGPAAAG